MDSQGFNQRVWLAVASIPPGNVLSYGQVARLAGYPGYARHVGKVLHALPSDTSLPWHRVVNARGHLALPSASKAYQRQRTLLENEGIVFCGRKPDAAKIPAKYFWSC